MPPHPLPPREGISEGSRVRLVGGTYGGCTGTFLGTCGSGIMSFVSIDDDTRASRRLRTKFTFLESPRLEHEARLALLHRILEQSHRIEMWLGILTTDAAVVTSFLNDLLGDEWPRP
jgi:hypothetical protein